MKTEMKTCETCEMKMDHWWDDEEGLPFCSSCFKEEGGQCDGCHWDDCVLCNEEEEEAPLEEEEIVRRMWESVVKTCPLFSALTFEEYYAGFKRGQEDKEEEETE
jgi:hypothetical protein